MTTATGKQRPRFAARIAELLVVRANKPQPRGSSAASKLPEVSLEKRRKDANIIAGCQPVSAPLIRG